MCLVQFHLKPGLEQKTKPDFFVKITNIKKEKIKQSKSLARVHGFGMCLYENRLYLQTKYQLVFIYLKFEYSILLNIKISIATLLEWMYPKSVFNIFL